MSSKDLAFHVSIGVASTFIVSWLDIRPMGIVFLGALVIWLYAILCPCSYTLENAKPIQDMARGNLEMFSKLRRDKPAVFCLIVSVALLLLMILGHIVSGTWLVIGGLSVIGLVSSRHSIRIVRAPKAGSSTLNEPRWSTEAPIPATGHSSIASDVSSSGSNKENTSTIGSPCSEVDEFLPEVNDSAMQVLNLAGNDAVLFSAKSTTTGKGGNDGEDADDDDDSVPMEMLMPKDALPDVERDRLTDEENLSEDEFGLHLQGGGGDRATMNELPKKKRAGKSSAVITTSDEEDDDEEGFAKGLNFDDFSDVDASQQPLVASYHSHRGGKKSRGGGAVPKELTGLMTEFVSNMIPWNKVGNIIAGAGDIQMSRSESSAVSKRRADRQPSFESSDDSEFELLNTDELNMDT